MRTLLVGLGLAGLFLGWNAPNHYPPWPAFHLEYLSSLGVALIGVATIAAVVPDRRPGPSGMHTVVPLSMASRLWLVAAAVPLVQYAAGMLAYRGDAVLGFAYGLGAAMSIYVGRLWVTQAGLRNAARALWCTIVLAGIAACGLALVQWLRLPNPGWWTMELIDNRPYANLAQPNHFGLLMVISVVAVTALFESGAIRQRWVHAFAMAFFGWGVLMSESRASALALVVIAALWASTKRRLPSRLRWRDMTSFVIGALLLALAIAPMERQLLLGATELRASPELGPREWIWLHILAAIARHPWVGYGFNQVVLAMADVAASVHPSRNVVYAHAFVLDLMVWAGVPLALAATAALLAWMLSWLRAERELALRVHRHCVLAVWLALAVQSCLEYPYAHAYFLLPAALLAGTATPVTRVEGCTGARPSVPAAALAVVAVALIARLGWEYFHLEADFRFNRFERAHFAGVERRPGFADAWLLDMLADLNASAYRPPRRGMTDSELGSMRTLARRFHILSTRLDYAKALALNGRFADARTELVVIRSVCAPAQFEGVRSHWNRWLADNDIAMPPLASTPE